MRSIQTIFLMVVMVFTLSCSDDLKDFDSGLFGFQPGDDTSTIPDSGILPPDSGIVPPDSGEAPGLGDGDSCTADADCASTHCECVNFDCSERVCAPNDCLCGYGTSGSCDESMTGTTDPEDCEGQLECATMDECIPID
jgi:hypothetical protein